MKPSAWDTSARDQRPPKVIRSSRIGTHSAPPVDGTITILVPSAPDLFILFYFYDFGIALRNDLHISRYIRVGAPERIHHGWKRVHGVYLLGLGHGLVLDRAFVDQHSLFLSLLPFMQIYILGTCIWCFMVLLQISVGYGIFLESWDGRLDNLRGGGFLFNSQQVTNSRHCP